MLLCHYLFVTIQDSAASLVERMNRDSFVMVLLGTIDDVMRSLPHWLLQLHGCGKHVCCGLLEVSSVSR